MQGEKESVPITAFFGPYSPDLVGTLRTFGQAGAYYDANGHYARVSPVFPDFTLGENNTLTPTSADRRRSRRSRPGQLRRCPGAATQPAADGSSPFVDSELLTCDPLADALMDRRRRNSLAGEPAADRRRHDADRRRRRVPLLQREQRPAVRADLQHQGRTAGGLGPAALQPGAHRRHARGRRQLADAAAGPEAPARSRRSPNLKLEKNVEPLPADTKAIVQSVSAIGLKYLELEKGTLERRTLKAGATIPASQTREPVNIEELFNMFDKKTRDGDQGQHEQLRQRPRGARARPQQHDRTNCARW